MDKRKTMRRRAVAARHPPRSSAIGRVAAVVVPGPTQRARTAVRTSPDDWGPQRVQRRAAAAQLGRMVGNQRMRAIVGAASQRVQRAPAKAPSLRAALQKRYGITIEKGDKDWSPEEIKDLKWSLGKLSRAEAKALRGYRFIRWSNPKARARADPTYTASAVKEGGLHEARFGAKKATLKISMYDKGFGKATISGTKWSRYILLHEIGHAMEVSGQRKLWKKLVRVETRLETKIAAYNKWEQGLKPRQRVGRSYNRRRKARRTAVDRLRRRVKRARQAYDAAVNRTLNAFGSAYKQAPVKTPYADQSMREAFADVFALHKIDPRGIRRANVQVAKWLQRGEHLK